MNYLRLEKPAINYEPLCELCGKIKKLTISEILIIN